MSENIMRRGKGQKVVGIVGGMGPRAVVAFLDKIVEKTPAEKDWEHLHLVVDNNTKIPSRTRHYLYGEASPVPAIVDSCRKLAAWPVDLIAIPCNSASHYLPEIQSHVDVPIANIMKISADTLARDYGKPKRCAVVGGRITYAEKTYRSLLEHHDIEYVHHDERLQEKVEATIEYIKKHADKGPAHASWRDIVGELVLSYGAGAIILGCTEFGCICNASTVTGDGLIIIDSSSELASYLVREACRVEGEGKC